MMKNKSIEDMYDKLNTSKDISKKANSTHTAQDLRRQVLDHGVFMIEKLQNSLHNKDEDISAEQQRSYDMLWPVLEGMISKTSDLKVFEAKSANEVLNAVSRGKLTFEEAKEMMALLKDQVTIDELPKLIEKLSEMEE